MHGSLSHSRDGPPNELKCVFRWQDRVARPNPLVAGATKKARHDASVGEKTTQHQHVQVPARLVRFFVCDLDCTLDSEHLGTTASGVLPPRQPGLQDKRMQEVV